jgi:hypothetical protein
VESVVFLLEAQHYVKHMAAAQPLADLAVTAGDFMLLVQAPAAATGVLEALVLPLVHLVINGVGAEGQEVTPVSAEVAVMARKLRLLQI